MLDGRDSSLRGSGAFIYIISNIKTSLKNKKAAESENRSVVARGCGWWFVWLLMDMGFLFGVMKIGLDSGDSCKHGECTKHP